MKLECHLIIRVPNMVSESDMEPIVSGLRNNNVELNCYYAKGGLNASADFLGSAATLILNFEFLHAMINSGAYDVFKHYVILLFKKLHGQKVYQISSSGKKEDKAVFSIEIKTKDETSITYNYEGNMSEKDIENSLNAFLKSLDKMNKSAIKHELSYASFDTKSKEWVHKTIEEKIKEYRSSSDK